ncbi:MAG: replication initiator protein A [Rhodospirillaceae bacterium]|nr:replication initiator protein A [Rhodospirillaceae bacterium]
MSNLTPHRHEADLFTADLAAAGIKELTDHLEFPIFGLQPQPRRGIRRLEFPDPRDPGAPPDYIELHPGAAGLPTIQDQDLLIYCCSKAMSEVNAGRPAPEEIRMSTAELLRFANRTLGGHQYAAIEASIYRLTTLTLKTNIRGEDAVYTELFGVVDHASMVRGTSPRRRSGALLGCSITLSKWIRAAIEARKILTLHDNYFRVRRPLDRAVYQLIRKHCGEQRDWTVGVDRLQAKIGSADRPSSFRHTLKRFAGRWEGEDFLDYSVRIVGDRLVAGYAGRGYRNPAPPPPGGPTSTRRTAVSPAR